MVKPDGSSLFEHARCTLKSLYYHNTNVNITDALRPRIVITNSTIVRLRIQLEFFLLSDNKATKITRTV